MLKSVVRKVSYKKLTQSELATFAANVHQRMASRPEYQVFAADITNLAEKTEAYTQALVEASNRGTDAVALKELAKNNVIGALDRIAFLLDFNFTGQDVWVINAGMEMIRERRKNQNKLEAPYQLRAMSKGVKGEISLQFRLPEPTRVRSNGVEYSLDNGETWHNGTYASRTTVTMSGLPSRQVVQFRVCSLGAFQLKSPFSEPAEAFVL